MIPKEWLRRRKEEPPVKTGARFWDEFVDKYQSGDEIWWYDNDSHGGLCARAGFALVRSGEVIAECVILQS